MMDVFKFELLPTEEQKVLLEKHFGATRFVYNWALDFSVKYYAENKKYSGWMTICKSPEFHALKSENKWLQEVNSQSLIWAIENLGTSYQRFFNHESRFPKHKSKKNGKQTFGVPGSTKIDFKHHKLDIPKFKNFKKYFDNRIRFRLTRHVPHGKICSVSITRYPNKRYYVSFAVIRDFLNPQTVQPTSITPENTLGIDFGVKTFLTTSDGCKINIPNFIGNSEKRLAKLQRKLSRKKFRSKNYEKIRLKASKLHSHISEQRRDFLHKISTEMVHDSQYNCFCFENLNMDAIRRRFGKATTNSGFSNFVHYMYSKVRYNGKLVVRIGRFDPSSQICSHCGNRKKIPLSERTYTCDECGLVIDRDVNAAINIRTFGIAKILKQYNKAISTTDGTSESNACGDGFTGGVRNNTIKFRHRYRKSIENQSR